MEIKDAFDKGAMILTGSAVYIDSEKDISKAIFSVARVMKEGNWVE